MSGHKFFFLFAALLAMTLSSCTTTGKKNATKSEESDFEALGVSPDKADDVIVHQPGRRQPAISRFDRKHWVNVRNASKPSHRKLYATLATGEWEAAEADARLFLRSNPKDKVALTVLALALATQDKYQLAKYYAKLVEKHHGQSADTLNVRALAEITQVKATMRDFKRAGRMLAEAFANTSTEIASGLNLGHLQLELGNASSALATFSDVKQRCNNCLQSLVGSGIAHSRMRKVEQARDDFEAVLAIERNHPQALYRLALIEKEARRPEKAKRLLDQLMVKGKKADFHIRQKAEELVRTLDAEDDVQNIASVPKQKSDGPSNSDDDFEAMESALEE